MPNWCENSVSFTHENPEMIQRIKRVIESDDGLFNEFVPMHSDLMNTDKGFFKEDTDKQKAMGKANNRNIKKHGYKDWYDFAINEWGTKWDVAGSDLMEYDNGPNWIAFTFSTAWSPPIEFYRKMEESHGYAVDAEYSETGCCFVGKYSHGHDECYSYNCKNDLELIPSDLIEGFCLGEMFDDEDEAQEVDDASWRA